MNAFLLLGMSGSAALAVAVFEAFRGERAPGRLAALFGRRPARWADPVGRLGGRLRAAVRRRRPEPGVEEAMESAILEISEALRAGASLFLALEQSAEHAPPALEPHLRQVVGLYRSGQPLWKALAHLEQIPGCEESSRRLVQVLRLHRRTGGDPRLALARLSQSLRQRRHRRAQLAARTAEARWTARFLAAMPPLLLLFLTATGTSPLPLLAGSPMGRIALLYALASWSVGVLVTRRLTRPEGV